MPAPGLAATRDRPVRERGRMLHERVDSAERHRVLDELARLGESGGRVVPAGELHRDDRPRSVQLAAEQSLRVLTRQSGVEHAGDGVVGADPLGEHARGLLLGAHAQRQRAQPAMQEVRGHRVQQATREGAHATQLLDPLLVGRNDSAHRRRRGRRGTSWRCGERARRRAVRAAAGREWRTCCRRAPGRRRQRRRPRRGRGSSSVGFAGVSTTTSPVSGRIAAAIPSTVAQVDRRAEQAALEDVIGSAVQRTDRDDVAACRRVTDAIRHAASAAMPLANATAPSVPSRSASASSNRATPGCHRRW